MSFDLKTFSGNAQKIRLTPEEHEAVRTQLLSAMGVDPLLTHEKADIRMDMHDFLTEYPLRAFAPLTVQPSLAPWSGTNLFGLLKPFYF